MAVTLHLKFLPRFSVYLPTGKLTQRPDPHFTLRKYNLVNGVLIENTRKSRVRSVYGEHGTASRKGGRHPPVRRARVAGH